MDISDFKRRFAGYAPGIMNARGRYAVLVPLVEVEGETRVLYEVRSKNIDVQPNEVCFPGGAMEGDESPVACALRETFEEIGVPPEQVDLLAELDLLYGSGGRLVFPVLGFIRDFDPDRLRLNPDEVGEVFTVPVDFLRREPYVYHGAATVPGPDFPYERMGITRDYPWRAAPNDVVLYEYEGHPIWGMTAMISRWLMERMRDHA